MTNYGYTRNVDGTLRSRTRSEYLADCASFHQQLLRDVAIEAERDRAEWAAMSPSARIRSEIQAAKDEPHGVWVHAGRMQRRCELDNRLMAALAAERKG